MSIKQDIHGWLSQHREICTVNTIGRPVRCAHALIAASIVAASVLSINPAIADTSIKVTLMGELEARNSAKLVGQKLTRHYDTVEQLITDSRRETQTISGGSIHFIRSDQFHNTKIRQNTALLVGDNEAMNDLQSEPMSFQSETMKARGDCAFSAPHFDDDHISPAVKSLYSDFISNAKTDRQDSYLFVVFHEYGHCLQNNLRTGSIKDEVKSAIQSALSQGALKSDESIGFTDELSGESLPVADAVNNYANSVVQESISDAFGALKVQQLYYLKNKSAIIAGTAPAVSPFLDGLLLTRSKRMDHDVDHNTTLAVSHVIDQLHQDTHLNERLANASDAELMITAYSAVDHTFSQIIKTAVNQNMKNVTDNYLTGEVDFAPNYLKNGVQSLFDDRHESNNSLELPRSLRP